MHVRRSHFISAALADGHIWSKTHHRHVYAAPPVIPPASSGFGGRALPCNQPVWVYGSLCEIGPGRGYHRDGD